MRLRDDLVDKWSQRVLEATSEWPAGAIFPSEMAMFAAACEQLGVDAIVESGRQDGYSTDILSLYGMQMHVPVVSLDMPDTPERGVRTRRRLAGRPCLTLLDGNSLRVFPRAVPHGARRIAFLIDGPKKEFATRLMDAARAAYPIVLLGYHGHYVDTPDGRERQGLFPSLELADPAAYQHLATVRQLREHEVRLTAGMEMGLRRVGLITLATAELGLDAGRLRAALVRDPLTWLVQAARYVVLRRRSRDDLAPPSQLLLLLWLLSRRS